MEESLKKMAIDVNQPTQSYCRLCAKLKKSDKCISFENDSKESQEIITKLTKFGLPFLDIDNSNLPKTVCIICLEALDQAAVFFSCVEKAQGVLNEIFLDHKNHDASDGSHLEKDFEIILNQKEEITQSADIKGGIIESNIKELFESFHDTTEELPSKKQPNKSEQDNSSDDEKVTNKEKSWNGFPWACSYCTKQFPNLTELTSHAVETHNICAAFKCLDCNRNSSTFINFLAHVTKKHYKMLRNKCYICYTDCKIRSAFIAHLREHKSDHISNGCDSSFTTQAKLKQHQNKYFYVINKKITDKDLTCTICDKKFSTIELAKLHIKKHSLKLEQKEEKYTCEICGLAFKDKYTVKGHLMVDSDVKPHKCNICNAAFKRLSKLRAHVQCHDTARPFKCEQCGKGFRLQKQLTIHSSVHTGVLPHACEHCNRGFRLKSLLQVHMRRHTGYKPYTCVTCPRDFTDWPNYSKHMLGVHGISVAKKKMTSEGAIPIDPETGKTVQLNMDVGEEWKKMISMRHKPGRKGKNDS